MSALSNFRREFRSNVFDADCEFATDGKVLIHKPSASKTLAKHVEVFNPKAHSPAFTRMAPLHADQAVYKIRQSLERALAAGQILDRVSWEKDDGMMFRIPDLSGYVTFKRSYYEYIEKNLTYDTRVLSMEDMRAAGGINCGTRVVMAFFQGRDLNAGAKLVGAIYGYPGEKVLTY